MKQFYRQYELLKDLPELPKGTVLKWDCWIERFTDIGDYIGLNKPTPKVSYTLEVIESKPDWFKGIGEQREYYPQFPSKEDFYSRDSGHGNYAVTLEYGHNDMCRVCQLLNKLDILQKVRDTAYEVIKAEYEKTYLKEDNATQ